LIKKTTGQLLTGLRIDIHNDVDIDALNSSYLLQLALLLMP